MASAVGPSRLAIPPGPSGDLPRDLEHRDRAGSKDCKIGLWGC
jgi:hypothetical protein